VQELPLSPWLDEGVTLPEDQADAVASLIRTTLPSLVTVNVGRLEPSCDVRGSGTGFTGLLTGSGEVIADGGTEPSGGIPFCEEL
jgi:hypothetical protein